MIRWTWRRKLALLAEIDAGLPEARAMQIHALSAEDLTAWRRDLARHGTRGLRATLAQANRSKPAHH